MSKFKGGNLYLGSSSIKFADGDIYTANGYTMCTLPISASGFQTSGTVSFSVPVSGVTPILDPHLATKGYVDDAIGGGSVGDQVTFTNLSANGDVGTGADQVAIGNHSHSIGNLTGSNWSVYYTDGSGVPTSLTLGTSGYVLRSNGPDSAPSWVLGGSGGGATYFEASLTDMVADSTDYGVDAGTAFGMVPSMNFGKSTSVNGTIWIAFNFKNSGFKSSSNVNMDMKYVMNGTTTTTKNVRMAVSYWVVNTGGIPVIGSPTAGPTSYDISVESTAPGTYMASDAFVVIPSGSLSTNTEMIILKLTRQATSGSDTYGGTMQLMKYIFRQ